MRLGVTVDTQHLRRQLDQFGDEALAKLLDAVKRGEDTVAVAVRVEGDWLKLEPFVRSSYLP